MLRFHAVPLVVAAAVPLLVCVTLTIWPTLGILYSPLLIALMRAVTLRPWSAYVTS